MKRKINPAMVAALLVLAAAAVLFVLYYAVLRNLPSSRRADLSSYFHISGEGEVGIVADGIVSKNPGRLFDGELYLPCETVNELVDHGFYYDAKDRLLILTRPTEILTFPADGTDPVFCLKNEKPYVSAAFVRENCPVEAFYGGEPARISFRGTEEVSEATVQAEGIALREGDGVKNAILRELSEGESLRVLQTEAGEGWTAVLTEDGLSGFVPSDTLSEAKATRKDLPNAAEFTHLLRDEPMSLVFHQTTDQASNEALPSYLEGVYGVTDLAPTWFFLDSEVGEVTSLASKDYVRYAHERELGVLAVFNDFDGQAAGSHATGEALSGFGSRSAMISRVVEETLASEADGICIDFENVTSQSAGAFIEFLRELAVSCRREGLVLLVCNYTPSFTKYYARNRQAEVVDYLVLMCYDEHTSHSPKAGSVASLPFVENGILETLKEVPREQLVAALPFYTRIWETREGQAPECRAVGMAAADAFVEDNGLAVVRDEKIGQDYASKEENGLLVEIWLENLYSLGEKLEVVRRAELAGIAAWKLGFETEEVWELFVGYLESERK